MFPTRHRSTGLLSLLVAGAMLAGCASTPKRAREEATRRWNQTRAQVKAKLAADQFQAGNVQAAAEELAAADRLAPGDPTLAPLRARVWLAAGETTRAAELLEQTRLEGAAQAEVEYLLGVVRQQEQRWDEALAAFLRAAVSDEREVAYVVAAVQVWLQLGEPWMALAFLEQRAGRFGWTNAYQAAMAECHEQLGDWPAAASAWRGVAAVPDGTAWARERLAAALCRAGQYAEALPVLTLLAEERGDDLPHVLRLMLAECHLAGGQHTAARQQVQRVLQVDGENTYALRMLARCLAATGEYGPALRAAQRALAGREPDVGTLELVAGLAWRAGERKLALESAARLRVLDARNPVARHILQQAGGALPTGPAE